MDNNEDKRNSEEKMNQIWIDEMKISPLPYPKPILDLNALVTLSRVCHLLKTDNQVFAISVDVLESYIRNKQILQKYIEDPYMAMMVAISLSSKQYTNRVEPIRISSIIEYLYIDTGKTYSRKEVLDMGVDILKTIDFRMPLSTKLNDLDLVYMFYFKPLKLKDEIRYLCMQLMKLSIMSWPWIYEQLHSVYSENDFKKSILNATLINRFYLPCSVIFCALYLSKSFKVLDKDKINKEILDMTGIHWDHLNILSNFICTCYKSK